MGCYSSPPVLQLTLRKAPCCLHYLLGLEKALKGVPLHISGMQDGIEIRITTTEKERSVLNFVSKFLYFAYFFSKEK